MTQDRKIILANPLREYAEGAIPADQDAVGLARAPISIQRRNRSAHIAFERVTQQRFAILRALVLGIIAMLFGGLLLFLVWARPFFATNDWIRFSGFILALGLCLLGAYMIILFSRALWSTDRVQAEIVKEIRATSQVEPFIQE